jgi:hypothetical protein
MSHLHVRCLDVVDEHGQAGGVEYFSDVDSGPADNEIAAAILAGAAAIFQRGPPAPARAIYGTIVTERAVWHGCMFTKPLRHIREVERCIRGSPGWGFRGATTHSTDATAVGECRDWLAKGRP